MNLIYMIIFQQAKQSTKPLFFMFGGTAILAAILIFLLPETFNKKLLDTVQEAKNL